MVANERQAAVAATKLPKFARLIIRRQASNENPSNRTEMYIYVCASMCSKNKNVSIFWTAANRVSLCMHKILNLRLLPLSFKSVGEQARVCCAAPAHYYFRYTISLFDIEFIRTCVRLVLPFPTFEHFSLNLFAASSISFWFPPIDEIIKC